jgi:3-phosphoglycerate kinase
MTENTRFYDEEEGNNEDFSRELAEPFSNGKGIFVNGRKIIYYILIY